MNRIDRLFGLVVLMQARGRVRAEELAAEFGVSRRTIYRDVAALNEAGIPVVSLPGEGYELVEGYFLPPLRFTVEEASALVLGARLLGLQAAGGMVAGAERATAKIMAALRGRTRDEVATLTEPIELWAPPARFDLEDRRMAALHRAIQERRVVRLRYHGRARDQTTEREVEPARLVYADARWYLSGYCRLRQGSRSFRVDRIDGLDLLEQTFQPRPAPDEPAAAEPLEVRVRVAAAARRWVRERQHYGFVGEAATAAGDAVMTYRVDAPEEILPWLRGWGADVEVLGPPDLRARMRRDAAQVVDMLT